VDCVVIDSLPALVPSSENEKEMEESTVGRTALLTNKFFRKVGKASKRSLTESERPFIGIMINQWRSKIGVMYGDPRTTPGGLGKDYAFFTRIEIKRDDWVEVGTGQEKHRVGQTIKIRTLKNKSAPPGSTALVDFYFGTGGPMSSSTNLLSFQKPSCRRLPLTTMTGHRTCATLVALSNRASDIVILVDNALSGSHRITTT
jgi:RecA/RadA recombinase